MTKKQMWAIENLKREVEHDIVYGSDRYEFKEFKVTEHEHFVNVVMEIGRKGDEGTMAEIYCRDRAQFFIGKRGGVRYPVAKKNGDVVERPFRSVIGTVVDQR